MVYKEEDIKDNIEALFLQTYYYFPRGGRKTIIQVICKALRLEDEKLKTCVVIESFLKEREQLRRGVISKHYFDDEKHRAYDMYLSLETNDFETLLNNAPKTEAFNEMKKDLAEYCHNYYKEKRILFPCVK